MNKEKRFQHYRPFLEYLFGKMPDSEYGALFWPGGSRSVWKHNFSRLISDGEKSSEVKRRIAKLLTFEPCLLERIGKTVDWGNQQLNIVDGVVDLALDRFCECLEPTWLTMKSSVALESALRTVTQLAESRDSRVPILWLGIKALLDRAGEMTGEHLRSLTKCFESAVSACSYMADRSQMIEAEIMFRSRVLTSNVYVKHRKIHTGFTANCR